MIFTSNFILNDGKQYEIAVLGKLVNSDGVLYFKIKEMLGSSQVLSALADDGSLCYVTASGDHPLPVAESGCINLTAIYTLLADHLGTTLPDDTYNKFAIAINQQLNLGVTAEDIKAFKEGCEAIKDYISKPVNFKMDIALTSLKDLDVKQLIDKINTGSHGLSFVNSGLNKTLKMTSPSSKVFIRLPNYADVSSGAYSLPTKDEVMPPYSNPVFETVHYKNYASGEDLPFIEGNASNNRLEIQDNEMEFYSALKEYLRYGIEQQYEKSLEEITSQELLDSDVYEYLNDLAERVLRFGWKHTGVLPEEIEEEGNNDETGEEDVETAKVFTILKSAGSRPFASGTIKLKGFIDAECSRNPEAIAEIIIKLLRWGNRKPNKIVVDKGMYDLELNTFQVMASKETYDDGEVEIVNGREFILVSEIDATGTFVDHTYLSNIGVNINTMHCPVGVVCTRTYLINNKKDTLLQYVYMSLADVVELLEERPNAIEGIKLGSDGKFTVTKPYGEENYDKFKISLEHAINKINADKEKENKLFVSDKVIEHALSVNAKTDSLGYLGVMKAYFYNSNTNVDLGRLNYVSVEECADKVLLGKSVEELVTANIAHTLFPAMLHSIKDTEEIMDRNGEITLEEVLDIYLINSIKYPIDLSLDDVEGSKPEPKVNTSSAEDKLKRLSLDTTNDNNVGGMVMSLKEQLGNLMYMDVPADAVLQPVKIREFTESPHPTNPKKKVKNYTGNDVIVAFFAKVQVEGGVKYLFTTLDETNGRKAMNISAETVVPSPAKALGLQDMVPILFNDFGRILQGREKDTKIRFSNERAMVTIINNLNKANIEL